MALDKRELEIVLQIIDACSTRGAFRGEELLAIGQIRARVQEEYSLIEPVISDEPVIGGEG